MSHDYDDKKRSRLLFIIGAIAALVFGYVLFAQDDAKAAASDNWVRTAYVVKPSGLIKAQVGFQDVGLHRLDVTYVLDSEEHYDTTSVQGSRQETGVDREFSRRIAPGLRLSCNQDDSRISCVVSGRDAYAVRFYNVVNGEFFNWGGGGAR